MKALLFLIIPMLLLADFTRNDCSETVYDDNRNLAWQDDATVADSSKMKDWYNAHSYCSQLDFAGVTDWRLPDIEELKSIVDTNISPSIVTGFDYIASNYYWSATTHQDYSEVAWIVYFLYGYVDGYDKDYNLYVRCVRAGQIAHLDFSISLDNSIVEANLSVGTAVGTLESGSAYKVSLGCTSAGADDANFTIENKVLKTANTFDIESPITQSICVYATNCTYTHEKNITITIKPLDQMSIEERIVWAVASNRTAEVNASIEQEIRDANTSGWSEGNTTGFNLGFTDGNTSGYNQGHTIGYNAGDSAGYSRGHSIGYSSGYSRGRSIGYSSGYNSGHSIGYTAGDSDGYDRGYLIGYADGNTTGFNLGFTDGNTSGYTFGYSDGNSSGYTIGNSNGYTSGFVDGNNSGYPLGYTDGNDTGYGLGRSDAIDDCQAYPEGCGIKPKAVVIPLF